VHDAHIEGILGVAKTHRSIAGVSAKSNHPEWLFYKHVGSQAGVLVKTQQNALKFTE